MVAHYGNIAFPNASLLDMISQVEAGPKGYLVPLLFMSYSFQAIGLSGFAGFSHFALCPGTYSNKAWTSFLSLIGVGYMLLAITLFRVPHSPIGLQVFAVTQIFALSAAFVLALIPFALFRFLERFFPRK